MYFVLLAAFFFHAADEALRRKVSLRACMTLQRHENVGQGIAEQLGVKKYRRVGKPGTRVP